MRPTLSLHGFAQHIFDRIDDFIDPVFCLTVLHLGTLLLATSRPSIPQPIRSDIAGNETLESHNPRIRPRIRPWRELSLATQLRHASTNLHAKLGRIRPGLRLAHAEPPNPSVDLRGNPRNPEHDPHPTRIPPQNNQHPEPASLRRLKHAGTPHGRPRSGSRPPPMRHHRLE
jgi:hypothetical protein